MNSSFKFATHDFIHVDNITKYRGRAVSPWPQNAPKSAILEHLSLTLRRHERVGLVGVSGCGKSTLLKAILALEHIDNGTIYCDGKIVTPGSARSLRWYRRRVQYLPQEPASTLPPLMRIKDILSEPLRRLSHSGNALPDLAQALEQVELSPGFLDKPAGSLSGGQAQRVALARALIIQPVFLLADEPVSGLDLPLREQIKSLLLRVAEENRMGLLLVSHDISMLAGLCERTLVMEAGKIIEDRPTQQLLHLPHHPHTRQLLKAVPGILSTRL
ncbi:ABC transporter ATP-binding protein [Enterobacter sp. DTU_2021_1002640_1_SI_PRY_ASU_LCPMC_013]|uniref:ABC transporter ATP-binding protein n=1 Tax=Enterobacter sp. DTU_2021_1002640_1_SI_PRY_ASU_LCPMC_013 TaxID=3077940 RepID=UPI0027F920A1|nr:ABC transporter ATP-binding protein [Enterobacter sp. DTU_2021_1002640_1_SI_PRY_ASU_LCPMC_013]EKY3917439.1 ABC transporter ATP-binding protein [Enterobacter hormaechei]WNU99112.1 ABC transporter ATP-binding protein [Enterobacter sp. DTU_2021_1002640_1_SI_PRY_ASU_LCPMC_013]